VVCVASVGHDRMTCNQSQLTQTGSRDVGTAYVGLDDGTKCLNVISLEANKAPQFR